MQLFFSLINSKRENLWRYGYFYPKISAKYHYSLENNFSPLEKSSYLADLFSLKSLYFKREDKNVTGSHKTRSLAYQVAAAKADKVKKLVISSTGNAAINAVRYAVLAKLPLKIFYSQKRINNDQAKFGELKKYQPDIEVVDSPGTAVSAFTQKEKARDLRPSRDYNSIIGFRSLGFEIFEQVSDLNKNDAIFLFGTSGSSLLGIYEALEVLKKLKAINSFPQIHLVQAPACTSLVASLDKRKLTKADQLFSLNIKKPLRKIAVLKAIKKTNGTGWIVSKKEVLEMKKLLLQQKISTSDEGIAAFAGLKRAISLSSSFQRVIVILTGKKW